MSSNPDRRFRQSRLVCVIPLAVALALTACSHNIEVRTIAAPDATFTGRSTFTILPTPSPRGGVALTASDPMLVNSITYEAIRDELRRAFEARGYTYSPANPDLAI